MHNLRRILSQEDTVLFIGAGISIWAGLPTWGDIINQLAKFIEEAGGVSDLVRSEAQKGDLLQAASYGFDKLTKHQIGHFIRSVCRYGAARPHEIHKKIVTLGPRCFITTNYDDLLEQSFRLWQPDRHYRPPVTNRHLTELAEIMHAQAVDFVFKPHGDAGDSESIILTREQYRQLLPQGERQAALESVKVLLATRPVVYFGFGLRDPDFMYLRDLLANTYRGGIRDHYAIMSDVSDAEVEYWRRHYGIHLISYATMVGIDKQRDHSALLGLLDELSQREEEQATLPAYENKAELVLALTRYAAGLSRLPQVSTEFNIRVHVNNNGRSRGNWFFERDIFHGQLVQDFLVEGPPHAILMGLPGAGKSYALNGAARCLAERLQNVCLAEEFKEKDVEIPIVIDLKLYRGALTQLVGEKLPMGLPFELIKQRFRLRVFIDSFNEMPKEFWENGSYEADFVKFIRSLENATIVIGSRTGDGLGNLNLPIYSLEEIEESAVSDALDKAGLNIRGRFKDEIEQLLSRPFYFQLVTKQNLLLPSEPQPRDIYQSYFANLNAAFSSRFGVEFDIKRALSTVAFDALNHGAEAFPLSDLNRTLASYLRLASIEHIDVPDIVNWLVAGTVTIPYTGARIAFVHQSITEYLAATELVRIYQLDPSVLRAKLALKRWDQALFLCLSLLPKDHAETFLQEIFTVDFALALNAARYLDVGKEEVVTKLLRECVRRRSQSDDNLGSMTFAVTQLPITLIHDQEVRSLIACGDILGAAGVECLVKLKGAAAKYELLKLLVERPDDFNLCCNGVGSALRPYATREDTKLIAEWADSFDSDTKNEANSLSDDIEGFVCGAAEFLGFIEVEEIWKSLMPLTSSGGLIQIRAKIIGEILLHHHSTAALEIALRLLLLGFSEAPTTIYFITSFSSEDNDLSFSIFNEEHVLYLLNRFAGAPHAEEWTLSCIVEICKRRPDLCAIVTRVSERQYGVARAVLLWAVSTADHTEIFRCIDWLGHLNNEDLQCEPLQLLGHIKIDWSGNENLLVKTLRLRNKALAASLFGSGLPLRVHGCANIDIGSIDWWLDWLEEIDATESNFMLAEQLGDFLGTYTTTETQKKFIALFNMKNSRYRKILANYVLPNIANVTTEGISEEAISFLLVDMNRKRAGFHFKRHLLGLIATEKFVAERLLSLTNAKSAEFPTNLRHVLEVAGSRHGRRYFLD